MFSHDEQEEIINKFLTACGEKQEEPEEEDFKSGYERLNKEAGKYSRGIRETYKRKPMCQSKTHC